MIFTLKPWITALVVTAIICGVSIEFLDTPIAQFFLHDAHRLHPLGDALGSAVLVSAITVVIFPLLIERLVRGCLSRLKEATIVSGIAALGSFTVNDFVLKRIFGRQDVASYLSHPVGTGFSMFGGDMYSSFPSGHSVMAAAALVVFVRIYPDKIRLLASLLIAIAILLVVGDWHFLSDVVAGLFIGASAGAVAGDLAKSHFEKRLRPSEY
jgi:membrane-associated phospholipid phosphatase